MLRHIIIIHSGVIARDVISAVNPPISTAALIQKHSIFVALISKLNESRTEITCQNLLVGRIVQNNVVEIIFLFVLR